MASDADGKVVFKIEGDTSGINKDIKGVTKVIEEESKKWGEKTESGLKEVEKKASTSSGSIEGVFAGMSAAIVAAIGKVVTDLISAFMEWASVSIDLASDLEQIQKVVDVTFGEAESQKIEQWTKTAETQFGLTELQSKKMISSMGVLLKGAGVAQSDIVEMSTSLTGLAADMGALYDMEPDKAFDKLKSAVSGSSGALKDFGIELNNANMQDFMSELGMEGKYKDLNQTEQYLLRYQYIMERMANIQNSYAREMVGTDKGIDMANQAMMNQMQLDLGQSLLPVRKSVKESINSLLKTITGNDGIVVTGTSDQLTQWFDQAQEKAVNARKELDALAESYSGFVDDMTREEFNPEESFFGSYGEFVYNTLLARQQMTGGKEREMIDAAIASMSELYGSIGEADTQIADLQAQMDKLASQTPDTEAAGAEAVDNLVSGLQSQEAMLQAEVDAINNILSQIGFGGLGGFVIPGFATGLDYVPKDNFPAFLHEGEAVLTAEENRIWQRFKHGSNTGMDYDALGGVMRDNIKAGGDVYLDGRTVGQVISDIQGRSYRNLQRSGWQG